MGKVKDISGETYSNLEVVEFTKIKNTNSHWLCKCKLCGSKIEVSKPNLRSGNTKDCGCMRSDKISRKISKHGMSNSSTWNTWSRMKRRAKLGRKHHETYEGIYVDPKWVNSFSEFLKDMGERPKGKTLDRIDNSKGYFKGNCRWATSKEQARNRSSNVNLTLDGITMCAKAWSELIGVHRDTIRRRINKDLPIGEVLKEYYEK